MERKLIAENEAVTNITHSVSDLPQKLEPIIQEFENLGLNYELSVQDIRELVGNPDALIKNVIISKAPKSENGLKLKPDEIVKRYEMPATSGLRHQIQVTPLQNFSKYFIEQFFKMKDNRPVLDEQALDADLERWRTYISGELLEKYQELEAWIPILEKAKTWPFRELFVRGGKKLRINNTAFMEQFMRSKKW